MRVRKPPPAAGFRRRGIWSQGDTATARCACGNGKCGQLRGRNMRATCGALQGNPPSARRGGDAMKRAAGERRSGTRAVARTTSALNATEYIGVRMMTGYPERRTLRASSPSGVTASTSRLGRAGLLTRRSSTGSSSAMISCTSPGANCTRSPGAASRISPPAAMRSPPFRR